MKMVTFAVPDMSCGHCKASVERAIASVDDKASVDVDLSTRQVKVISSAEVAALMDALKDAGYPSHAL